MWRPKVSTPGDFQTTLRFGMEGATDFLVAWRRKMEAGESRTEVLVLDADSQAEPGKQFTAVFRQPLETLAVGVWRVSYRHGAIVIAAPGQQPRFHAYVEKGAAAALGLRCKVNGNALSLIALTVRGASNPAPPGFQLSGDWR